MTMVNNEKKNKSMFLDIASEINPFWWNYGLSTGNALPVKKIFVLVFAFLHSISEAFIYKNVASFIDAKKRFYEK